MHPAAQIFLAFAALVASVSSGFYTFHSFMEAQAARGSERNAQLVGIGISVLRVDPQKEGQISAARKWALDLIDANAGGVKFSNEARTELLRERLTYSDYPGYTDYYTPGYTDYPAPNPAPAPGIAAPQQPPASR